MKYKTWIIYIITTIFFLNINIISQGFTGITTLTDIDAYMNSGSKPQSKVWKHDNFWWAVIPVSDGTYIYRLDSDTWTQDLFLTSSTSIQADTKNVGDKTYILLFDGDTKNASLATVLYNSGTNEYSLTAASSITLDSDVETATIDIDGNGRMWLASDDNTDINVRWSDSPYSDWTNPKITLASNVTNDDICAVTAFDDEDSGTKIGVLWSNQTTQRFGFKFHVDGQDVETWSTDEVPGDTVALDIGNGIADDHINFAVDSRDGTIYAAVKTSYDASGYALAALLVRSPDRTWDFYSVRNTNGGDREPTRPIAILDETNNIITVVYTQDINGNDIMYKSSSINDINFYPSTDGIKLLENTNNDWDNATSTKQSIHPDAVVLVSSRSDHVGAQIWGGRTGTGITPTPIELAYFAGVLNGEKIELHWRTETEVNNYGFNVERFSLSPETGWQTIGFTEGHGNSNSPKYYVFIDSDIKGTGNYYYRLKQIDNDGTYKYSDVVTMEVNMPEKYYLSQNYPNPFNPETKIDFSIPEKQLISLKIYNVIGEQVAELLNEVRNAGSYSVTFNGTGLPSGIYVYSLKTENLVINKKMTLLK